MRIVKQTELGFTLVELLLVTIILGVLIGTTVPRFRKTFDGLNLRNTSFSVYKLISFAREKAVMTQKDYTVSFDFDSQSYELLEWNPEARDPQTDEIKPRFQRASGRFGKRIFLPEGISAEGSQKLFSCSPDGSCQSGQLRLRSREAEYEVRVSEAGDIKIKEAGLEY